MRTEPVTCAMAEALSIWMGAKGHSRVRQSTQALVLDYLEKVGEERTVSRICAYTGQMHKRSYRATVAAISRLHVAGLIDRVGVGRYRKKGAG